MALVRLLREGTTASVPAPKSIVTVGSKDSPRDAFAKLIAGGVLSAPVLDTDPASPRHGEFIGFLDIRDMVSFIVFENEEEDRRAAAAASKSAFLDRMVRVGATMYKQPMDGLTVTYLCKRHPYKAVQEGDSLWKVAELLTEKGIHRVPVMNKEGKIINVISQSRLIQYLDQHRSELTTIGAHTVAEANCGSSPVLFVKETDSVLVAYKKMSDKDIMGIAVCDEDGKYIGNTSSTDLKLYVKNPTVDLHQPIIDFLAQVRQKNLHTVHPAIHVTSKDTLAHVIGRLAATKIHRVYVVDDGSLTSVISLTDLLRYVFAKA